MPSALRAGNAAGIVADALAISRSPARKWVGRESKSVWMSRSPSRHHEPHGRENEPPGESRSAASARAVMRRGTQLQLGRAVAAGAQVALDQREDAGHARLGRRAVGDVLARERLLVHARVHVAGVDGVDAQVVVLDREHGGEVVERGLGRAVAAPALVRLLGRVGAEVDDARAVRERELDERERREHVDGEDLLERVERVVRERRLRARPEDRRVVDQQLQVVARGGDQGRAVLGVGDVAGDGDRRRSSAATSSSGPETRASMTSRHPRSARARAKRESEAAGGAGDDGGGHAFEATAGPARPPSGIGPRTANLKVPGPFRFRRPGRGGRRTARPACGR